MGVERLAFFVRGELVEPLYRNHDILDGDMLYDEG
jgi:hypothetical protein